MAKYHSSIFYGLILFSEKKVNAMKQQVLIELILQMENLPSKSLSKSILIAVPLFCLVLALLDSSDQISYLFVLQFLGNVAGSADIIFLPTQQPEIGDNYEKYQYFKYQGIDLMETNPNARVLPLLRSQPIQKWAQTHNIVRGVSPRWLVPVVVSKIDSLILVSNVTQQLSIGVGLKSNLQTLKHNEVALSSQLLSKTQKKIGDSLSITLSIKDMLNGRKLVDKYRNMQSQSEDAYISQQQIQLSHLSKLIYQFLNKQELPNNITVTEQSISQIVEKIYNLQYTSEFLIKYQYKNNGLYSSTLNNVILMEFPGFANVLSEFLTSNILYSKQFEEVLFSLLDQTELSAAQKLIIKTYFSRQKKSNSYKRQISQKVLDGVQQYPLLMIACYNHRQLVYHPDSQMKSTMYSALESTPGDIQVVSIYPFFQDLDNIRYFFKSVIQIFTFVCAVIFFNTMKLILKQVYEEKEIEVGIWRTLGAGGVRQQQIDQNHEQGHLNGRKLKPKLTFQQQLYYGYKMLEKVGFFKYWLLSCIISVILYQILKIMIYNFVANLFKCQAAPPQYILTPFILFIAVFGFIMALVISHIRQIYVNPLVSTIKPVKRTFDLVKIRLIKIATFGITIEVLIIGILLVYYGVVSYYWIPLSILEDNGYLQTVLFNSIFIFMVAGSIMVLVVMQSRMECWVLAVLFRFSKHLSTLKLIMLKSIKAKQYKNLKVSLIISLIFAFLLFFTAGIKIQLKIIQSFSQRQLGADLIIQNFQKVTLNRTLIEQYLSTIKGIRYTWLSQNLQREKLKLQFETITKKGKIKSFFKSVTPNFLDVAFHQYYYPQLYYQPDIDQLETLPNGLKNGFTTLYKFDGLYNNISIGHYDPSDTVTQYDPNSINLAVSSQSMKYYSIPNIPPEEQVLNVVTSSTLRKKLGAQPGDIVKLVVNDTLNNHHYYMRCRLMHSFKMAPGIDLFRDMVFMTQSQANYLYDTVGYNRSQIAYYKLFVTGRSNLQEIGNKIVSMSPGHTLIFDIIQTRLSFELLQTFLNKFILFVTVILALLSVLFLSVYTYGKCKEQAEVFKMLRAIGLSVFDIRLMIYLQILIRMTISIVNGILLGLMFSLGLSGQIEEILMLKAPLPKLDIVLLIAVTLLTVFSFTVIKSTNYLTKRTVAETSNM